MMEAYIRHNASRSLARKVAKSVVRMGVQVPGIRGIILRIAAARMPHNLTTIHPFDVEFGVRTSGWIPGYALTSGDSNGYGAVQPSILRYALSMIPKASQYDFIDIGCGKGRALLIASEYNFPSVIGVEYSPILARIARRNARHYAHTRFTRSSINVVVADATRYELPTNPIVIFFYNSFPRHLVEIMANNLDLSLRVCPRDVFVVALNPVSASVFDAFSSLKRYFAGQVPYGKTELGFGPDRDDAVVIWCNHQYTGPLPASDRDAEIAVLSPMRAVLKSTIGIELSE